MMISNLCKEPTEIHFAWRKNDHLVFTNMVEEGQTLLSTVVVVKIQTGYLVTSCSMTVPECEDIKGHCNLLQDSVFLSTVGGHIQVKAGTTNFYTSERAQLDASVAYLIEELDSKWSYPDSRTHMFMISRSSPVLVELQPMLTLTLAQVQLIHDQCTQLHEATNLQWNVHADIETFGLKQKAGSRLIICHHSDDYHLLIATTPTGYSVEAYGTTFEVDTFEEGVQIISNQKSGDLIGQGSGSESYP